MSGCFVFGIGFVFILILYLFLRGDGSFAVWRTIYIQYISNKFAGKVGSRDSEIVPTRRVGSRDSEIAPTGEIFNRRQEQLKNWIDLHTQMFVYLL